MKSPKLFVGKNVMSDVAAMLPKRGPTRAAVAYLTFDHLGLRKGDAIAVNASEAAVRSGATDPRVLLGLLDRDVVVVNQPMLHAKAIVRGTTVAVGSANLSRRTLELDELMWVTQDEELLRRTLAWVDGLLRGQMMVREQMEALVPLYATHRVPVSGGPEGDGHEPAGPPPSAEDPFDPATVSRLWLWVSEQLDDGVTSSDAAGDVDLGGLSGKEWVLNESLTLTREGDVWVRAVPVPGWLHPPQRVVKARSSDAAPDGSHWTLVGFDADAVSVRTPEWVKEKYGLELQETGEVLVDADDIPGLLVLWRS